MVKTHTTLSIDSEIIDKAKMQYINMSDTLEEAIRKKLNMITVDIAASKKCEFCGREQDMATKENLDGLTWLWPDEKWICTFCLSQEEKVLPEEKQFTNEKRAEILQIAKNYVLENKEEIISQMKGKEIL
jgi:hypothetical protein